MHFRPYDAELSLGGLKVREDLIGIIRHEASARLPSSEDATSKLSTTLPLPKVSAPQEVGPDSVHGDAPIQQYPKRVSFTSDERLLDSAALSDDNESEEDDGNESAESVAEILRQMSQAPSTASSSNGMGRSAFANAAVAKAMASMSAMDSAEQEAALALAGKRRIPTSFNGGDSSEPSTKKVRWLPESSVSQETAARFFHRMPRRASGKSAPAPSTRASLPVIPVLKPVPGLKSYDVIIGHAFISHFNLGNRRLLVLAMAHAGRGFSSAKPEDQEAIVDSLYDAIQSAGGRFVQMLGRSNCYEDVPAKPAKEAIVKVLMEQEKQLSAGTDLLNMFQRKYSYVWGGSIVNREDDESEDEEMDKKPAAVTNDAEDDDSEELSGPTAWRKSIRKFEPMTPLGPDYQPGPFDVICSRGSVPRKHAGNQWFISLVEQNCERYVQASGKMAKSLIVSEILDIVRSNGGFVKQDEDQQWCETGDHLAREKIGQAFRDRLHTNYSSSSKAKLEKRKSNKSSNDNGSESSEE